MRLTLPIITLSLLAGPAMAHAQDRYSAGAAQLRGSQPAPAGATVAVRAVDTARAPQRLLNWPGKVASAAAPSTGPGPFMAASLSPAPTPNAAPPARAQQPAYAPRVAVVRPAPQIMAPPPRMIAPAAPAPMRATAPVQIVTARPSPAATQAPDWPTGETLAPAIAQSAPAPAAQAPSSSSGPPPFTPGPGAWEGARGRPLPSNIYEPAPPAPAAAQSSPAAPSAVAAQPGGQGPAPASAGSVQAQVAYQPAAPQAFASAGGVPTRQYSVHRKYGGTPDPIQMPADFFASTPPPDLAEPPPPVERRLTADGKTSTQAKAAASKK